MSVQIASISARAAQQGSAQGVSGSHSYGRHTAFYRMVLGHELGVEALNLTPCIVCLIELEMTGSASFS
jgi:hypothetical protein